MRTAVSLVVFALAAVAQWLVPLAGVWRHERVVTRGAPVRICCAAPDPYDPLRGRYLAVRPEQETVPAPAGMPERASVPVWAELVTGADGLARIESLSLEPLGGPHVIRLMASRRPRDRDADEARLEWPFDRFYVNERLAPDADALVAERFRAGERAVAEIRLLDGRAVLVDVLVDGGSIREIVRRRVE